MKQANNNRNVSARQWIAKAEKMLVVACRAKQAGAEPDRNEELHRLKGGTMPVRLQRSRAKGSRPISPNGLPVACVTRPSKYGNPYVGRRISKYVPGEVLAINSAHAVNLFRREIQRNTVMAGEVRRMLRGKNLACWCRLCPMHRHTGKPIGVKCLDCADCHADVLLEIANKEKPSDPRTSHPMPLSTPE